MAGRVQLDDVRETVTCGICLQLLTDPRGLTCGHTYCLVCLRGFQGSTDRKECPVCRANTVPSKHDLDRLPTNKLAFDLVKLVHTYEPATKEEPAEWNVPQKKERKAPNGLDPGARLATLMAMLEGLHSDDGSDVDSDGAPRHRSITCDNCRKSGITGSRFKCGICEDYDLCEKCEAEPRDRIHDPEHIFIKLKKPRTTGPAMMRVLHEDATVMGMTQDKSTTEHAINIDGKNKISTTCDNCKTSPIKGKRYKCGICNDYDICETCEKTSEEFHDPRHVFLVLPHPVGLHTTVPQLTYSFYR